MGIQGNSEIVNASQPPNEANEAYDESRRLLVEVRQRLEDTRTRIEDARAIISEGDDHEVSESIVEAQQGLDRTVAFASR